VTPFAVLHGLRVGCVQYLNAKPLIVPYDGDVVFEHPARLADLLAAGEIDVALVPVFEALRRPELPIVDGVAIASRGPVYSVFLAHCAPLADIRAVSLDPASRTSNNLLRCLLAEFRGLAPAFEPADLPPSGDRAQLLIGNQAIRFRQQPHPGVQYLDFGEDWLRQTGLPFVYAVWQIRRQIESPCCVARALRAVQLAGLQRVREIAGLQRDFDPAFAQHYLTEHIRFDMGDEEKAGLARFRALLQKHRLIPQSDLPLHFV
jgi:predicted solute-binding protein